MKKLFTGGIVFLFSLLLSCSATKDFNIVKYGAVSDSTVLNTLAVQKAIDACAKRGGRVIVPEGDFVIGTIILKSNVELHLEKGGQLLGSLNLDDYSTETIGAIEAPAFDKCLVYANEATNVKISGEGIINGRGAKANFPIRLANKELGQRPMLIRFIACHDMEFCDVTFMNSASWGVHLVDCEDVVVRGVTINSRVNGNNDGFDIDGCKRVLIEQCNVRSGDDALCPKSTTERICEDITIKNCRIDSRTSGFKLGTSSRGGFRNIEVTDCDFSDTRLGAIKLLMVDGGIIDNIRISNIIMNNVEGPIFIRLANRGRLYDKPTEQVYQKDTAPEGAEQGTVKNIYISNIKATIVGKDIRRFGIMISGIPGAYIENVVLKDIDITYPGGVKKGEFLTVVPEDETRYPEQFFFGVLPSWGAYVRHAKNITFDNVTMRVLEADDRQEIVLDDVEGFERK